MRWKFVIPALILVALVAVFNIFFLDSLIRKGIITVGQMVFGAKVEVASVKTRFSALSIRIARITVADKNDVWRNLFEVGGVDFALEPWPLLSKKIIIDDMVAEGIRWGTKRTTSGALPPAKAKKYARENERESGATARLFKAIEQRAAAQVNALPSVETLRNVEAQGKNLSVEGVVNAAELQSLKGMEALETELNQKYTGYQQQIQSININDTVTRANAAIAAASQVQIRSAADIPAARDRITQLNEANSDIDRTYQQLQNLQSGVTREMGLPQDVLNRINDLKNKDVQQLSSMLKLPNLSLSNLSEVLFGPVWVGRVNDAVYYITMARKYMPPRKKQDPIIIKPREKGTNVSFPKQNVPPDFLVRRIRVSGSTGGDGKTGAAIDFTGNILNVTSDPVLLGIPTTFDISGAGSGQSLVLKGIFDHTQEVPFDSLQASLTGLPGTNFKFPQSDLLPSFADAQVGISSVFNLRGGALESSMSMNVGNLRPATASQNEDVRRIVAQLWSGINSIMITAKLSGTADNLAMGMSSSVDGMLSSRLQGIFGAEVVRAQEKVRAEVDRLTEAKKNEVMARYTSQKDQLQNEIQKQQKALQDQANALQAQVKQKEDEIKAQAGGELQRRAQEQLKGLFGK